MSASITSPAEKAVDLLLVGASGFTGKLVAKHIAENYPGTFRLGLCGRNPTKLQEVVDMMTTVGGKDFSTTKIYLADALNRTEIDAAVREARVVISTAGPFWRYSRYLVASCAQQGVHYLDITGEPQYVVHNINHHAASARASGAKIISMCGVDSIPSDLATYRMVSWLREQKATPGAVTGIFDGMGGFSGGTVATGVTMFDDFPLSELRKLSDPYYMAPETPTAQRKEWRARGDVDVHKPTALLPLHKSTDSQKKRWLAPWIMGPINAKVVRRTRSLLPDLYGPNFRYREGMVGPRWVAAIMSLLPPLTAFLGLTGLLKRLVKWGVLPAPGQGPSEEMQTKKGWYRIDIEAEAVDKDGNQRVATCSGGDKHRDPGYWGTSRLVLEAALCLVLDADRVAEDPRLPQEGGVFTPAYALGEVLVKRLGGAKIIFDTPRWVE